jgi:hypothetical protein
MLGVGLRVANIPYHLLSGTFIRQQFAPLGVTLVSLYIKCTLEFVGFYYYSELKHIGLLNIVIVLWYWIIINTVAGRLNSVRTEESFVQFLGAFAKFRKATISFVMSVCPSVRPHGTTRLPQGSFS